MAQHALLSASSSQRWLNCTPSARLEEHFENTSSIFAEEGTAAHALAEYKLKKYLGTNTEKPVSEFDGEELEYYTDMYLDFAIEVIEKAKENCNDPIILIEQKLDYSCFVPEGFGTGDLVVVADNTLDIVDLKYGRGVVVMANDNPQMKLYALGALVLFDFLYDIDNIRMTICQPRLENISTFEMSKEELLNWAEKELKPKAELAINGEGEFIPGEHCRFCKARYTCRARADELMSLAKHDFKLPAMLTEEEIAEVLNLSQRISQWADDVYAYATEKAINEGIQWKGFKLVEGRSNRKYINEEEVIKTCMENGITDIYKQSLKGISEMEKLMGKKMFSELISTLIEKPKGKITLVPESDKRQEVKNTAEIDFKEEI
jgi:hypothetical protein